MGKLVLIQYCEMREEIKGIRQQIRKLDSSLLDPRKVQDIARQAQRDVTTGNIRASGGPVPEYYRKRILRDRYQKLLEKKEEELLELACQAEEYIQSVPKSEMRTMFRLYYIDGLPWRKVAQTMNRMFPKRSIKFTEDSCWQRNKRFFEEC